MTASSLRCLSSVIYLAAFAFPATSQTPPGTLATIWNFAIGSSSGLATQPETGVIIGPNGVLYGTAWANASIFSLTPPTRSGGAWTYAQLYSFPYISPIL